MTHQYHLTRISGNRKLGGLPASTTSSDTCPVNCSFRDGGGCYGDGGPVALHWRAVSERRRGVDLDTFCAQIKMLPRFQLWRHNQVGDLPGDGHRIDGTALRKIVQANRGKKGFTFTHYSPLDADNARAVVYANAFGFTVNLSAENLAQADVYAALGPTVVVLPEAATKNLRTPAGRKVVVCPASVSNQTCAQCAMCADSERTHIIGFPAHGSGAKKVEKVFWAKQLETA